MDVPSGVEVESDDYVKRRDDAIKRQNDLATKEPGAFLGGTLAGGLVSGLATAGIGGAAKAATVGQRLFQAGKTGAIMGGLANPGDTEGEISPIQPIDRIQNAGIGAGAGVAIQGGLEGVAKAAGPLRSAKEMIAPKLKNGWEKVLEAAESLGIKPTPAMLAERGGFVERMEDSLQNSPSIFGANVRSNRSAVQDKLAGVAGDLGKDASNLTPSQIGDNFKSGIAKKITDRADTAGSIFDNVADSTKHIPVGEKSLNAVGRNIENMDSYRLLPGGKPQQYREMLSRVQNANDVKTVTTLLGRDIESAQGAEKQILIEMKNKLQNLEKNSITRAAISQAKNSGEGSQVAKELIDDLKAARSDWRGIHEDMSAIGKPAGISSKGGPGAFNAKLDAIPSQAIQDKFLNPQKLEGVNALKEKFPEQFDLLRQGKLRDIMDASLYKGDVSAQRFVKEAGKLDPEIQGLIFGENAAKINQMKTLVNAIPDKFNPSGTAGQSMFSRDGLMANIGDVPRFGLYKAASNTGLRSSVASGLESAAGGFEALASAPSAVGSVAGATSKPVKPFDEPASQIMNMDSNFLKILGKNPQMLEQIKDPKLRDSASRWLQKNGKQKDPRQSFIEGN